MTVRQPAILPLNDAYMRATLAEHMSLARVACEGQKTSGVPYRRHIAMASWYCWRRCLGLQATVAGRIL
eukprot:360670-Chlamydomonas_euryale.AAC.1